MPTFVEIAGGAKDNDLNQQLMEGKYPCIVKTKLNGVNQLDYLTGKSVKSARDTFFLLRRPCSVGSALQELEDLLRDGDKQLRMLTLADALTNLAEIKRLLLDYERRLLN